MCLADYIWAHLSLGRPESQSQTHLLAAKRPAAVRTRCRLVHFWGREVSFVTVFFFFSPLFLFCFVCFISQVRIVGGLGLHGRPPCHVACLEQLIELWLYGATGHIIKWPFIAYGFLSHGWFSCFMIGIFITQFAFLSQTEVELGDNGKNVPFTGSGWTETSASVFGKRPHYFSIYVLSSELTGVG